jgi:hypothetical protein
VVCEHGRQKVGSKECRRQLINVSMADRRSQAQGVRRSSSICGRQKDTCKSLEATAYVSMAGRRICLRSLEAAVYVGMAGRVQYRSGGSSMSEHGRQEGSSIRSAGSSLCAWRAKIATRSAEAAVYVSMAGEEYIQECRGSRFVHGRQEEANTRYGGSSICEHSRQKEI